MAIPPVVVGASQVKVTVDVVTLLARRFLGYPGTVRVTGATGALSADHPALFWALTVMVYCLPGVRLSSVKAVMGPHIVTAVTPPDGVYDIR